MSVKTEGLTESDVILYEADKRYSREVVTILSGAGALEVGAVLGKVTASKKYIPSPAAEVTGSEGAETATAVLLERVDATSADAEAVVLMRHALVNRSNLSFATSVSDATKRQAKIDQLAAVGIISRQGA